ncbi:hypothetical protein LXL04_009446 [Taraxacum kok-saghyz]
MSIIEDHGEEPTIELEMVVDADVRLENFLDRHKKVKDKNADNELRNALIEHLWDEMFPSFYYLYGDFEYQEHLITTEEVNLGALTSNGEAFFAFFTDSDGFYDLGDDENPTISGKYMTLEGIVAVDLFLKLERIT